MKHLNFIYSLVSFPAPLTDEEKAELDGRSIYVGNVS